MIHLFEVEIQIDIAAGENLLHLVLVSDYLLFR
ncbi:uncharacterized protein METZ01_LOCUS451841, partial [marine metagenome]